MTEKAEKSNYGLQVLNQSELLGRQFTVYGTAETPLFLAKDVAAMIEHTNPTKMLEMVDDDEKAVLFLPTNHKLEGLQANTSYSFLTEDGLYEVLMQSRKPIAKEFKKGVKAILKEIRTNGGYIATREDETPEELLARALTLANETLKRKENQLAQAQQTISVQATQLQMAEGTIEEQTKEIKEMKPLAEYTEGVLQSTSTYTLTQVAKDLGFVSVYKFTDWCKQRSILYYQSKQWIPNAKFSGQGYFATRTHKYIKKDDTVGTDLTTVVTERGRMWLHSLVERAKEQESAQQRILPVKATGQIEGEKVSVYLTEFNNPCVIAREVCYLLGYENLRKLIIGVSKNSKRRMTIDGKPIWVLSYEGVCEAIAKSECVNAESLYNQFKQLMKGKEDSRATA